MGYNTQGWNSQHLDIKSPQTQYLLGLSYEQAC